MKHHRDCHLGIKALCDHPSHGPSQRQSDDLVVLMCDRCGFESPEAMVIDLAWDGWAVSNYSMSNNPGYTFCDACAAFLGAFDT